MSKWSFSTWAADYQMYYNSLQYTASEILTSRVYSFIILEKDSKKINVISIGGPEPFLKEGT